MPEELSQIDFSHILAEWEQFVRACREAIEVFVKTLADAFIQTHEYWLELSPVSTELSTPVPPPTYPNSSAYFSKRTHDQPKRIYRQERVWRHRG